MSQFNELVRIGPLVIIPSNELQELRGKLDRSFGIEHRSDGVRNEVLRDARVLAVLDDSCHITLGSLLDGVANLIPSCLLLEFGGQIDNGDVGGGNTESHTGKLAIQLRDDFTDSLSSSSR